MFLRISSTEYFIKPVCIRISYIIRNAIFVQSIRIDLRCFPAINTFLREDRFGTYILASLIYQTHIVGIIAYKTQFIIGILHYSRIRIGNLRLSLSCFRGNQNNTVSCSSSVDSGRSCIFQHRNAFYVVWIHIIHTPFNTIY